MTTTSNDTVETVTAKHPLVALADKIEANQGGYVTDSGELAELLSYLSKRIPIRIYKITDATGFDEDLVYVGIDMKFTLETSILDELR